MILTEEWHKLNAGELPKLLADKLEKLLSKLLKQVDK